MTQISMDRTRSTRHQPRQEMSPLLWGLLGVFLLSILITAYLTFLLVREAFAPEQPAAVAQNVTGFTPVEPVPTPLAMNLRIPLQDPNGPTPLAWDGAGRVTVLVMGLDLRDYEEGGAARTDTMLLLTVDPQTKTAGILSIPRDLWVNIPGFDYGKINTAYYIGEIYDLPGGGPAMAVQTVEQLLGVPINYYARIDFAAFVVFIDQIGGIEIDVPEEIAVDPIGPHNTVILDPGMQRLDGATALAYARNRDTAGGDFDRAQRQQQVILAMRNRILNLQLLPKLIEKAPELYKQLSSGVHTNLSLDELMRLAWLVEQIPVENIQRAAINFDQVTSTYSPEGLDILLPDSDKIRELRDQIFTDSGPVGPSETAMAGDPQEMMAEEAANVSVLNATFTIGLAAETGDYLKSQGINVVYTGNADEAMELSAIIDYTGNPYTRQRLVEILNIEPSRIYSRYNPNSEIDIAVLLGDDWANENPIP